MRDDNTMENQDIKPFLALIFLKFNIAEDTQKDALEIFQNIIEKQEKLLDKVSLFATCLLYCVHRQNNCVKVSI